MSASELQQQRTRGYFIEAAKEILRGEGLKAASARNIASRAGYSYTALYNYFDDMNALIFECVSEFQKEIEQQIAAVVGGKSEPDERIRAGIKAWVNYFVQYPGIFELFFLERIGEVGHRSDIADLIYNSIVPACRGGLEKAVAQGLLSEAEKKECLDLIRNQITGILLYYSNRKNPPDYPALIKLTDRQLDLILGHYIMRG